MAEIAALQHGVVALPQLVALGLSASAVRGRVRRGLLYPVHRGVYAVGHPALAWNGKVMAAVLAYNRAVASHRVAADLHGVRPTSSPLIEVSIPRGSGRARPGIRIHRTRRMETTLVDRIPCTTLAQTFLDLAEVVPRNQVENAITRAEQLRIFDLRDVERVLAHADGRHGAPVLQSVIAQYRQPLTKSELERLFLAICRKYGIPAPRVNETVNGFEVDFHWPELRLIVETDGWETHGTRAAFEEDRSRDQIHHAAGWRVVRFTWRQVVDDPAYVGAYTSSIVNASSPTSRNLV